MRYCGKCRENKEEGAYVGARDVCRSCWFYLPPEEKEKYILHGKAMERKKLTVAEKLCRYRSYTDPDVD